MPEQIATQNNNFGKVTMIFLEYSPGEVLPKPESALIVGPPSAPDIVVEGAKEPVEVHFRKSVDMDLVFRAIDEERINRLGLKSHD